MIGHDTTSSALAFAIHYLAQNPVSSRKKKMQKLQILMQKLLGYSTKSKRRSYQHLG